MAVGGTAAAAWGRCKKRKPGGYVFTSTHCGTRVADVEAGAGNSCAGFLFIFELETRCCQRTPPDAEAFMSQKKRTRVLLRHIVFERTATPKAAAPIMAKPRSSRRSTQIGEFPLALPLACRSPYRRT